MKTNKSETDKLIQESEDPKNTVEWIVTLSSTLSMGLGAAVLFSIRSVNPSLEYVLDWKTWSSLLLVGWLTYWGCRVILFPRRPGTSLNNTQTSKRRWLYTFGAFAFGGTAASMAYSLRGISTEKLMDVGIGVMLATIFLSVAAFLFLRTVRFLRDDEATNAIPPESIPPLSTSAFAQE